jgi:glycine cleavage system H protein
MSQIIDGLYYAASHEWLLREGDHAVIGITDHAQHELTDVVYVELPKLGKKISAKGVIAVVESVKAASDIYSPVSGEVIAVNEALTANPALINTAPFTDGWIYKIKLNDEGELSQLQDAAGYRQQLGG